MAALELYTLATVYVNGALLSNEISVSLDRKTNSQPVNTVVKGYAGESPGAKMLEIKAENGVPSSDFELDAGSFMKDLSVVEVTIFAAGKTLTSKGFIYEDNFSHAVNSESKLSFSFRGQYADWT